jgi:triosephosphate isomerase (TIM)
METEMSARNRWVIGNWKMNGSLASNASLVEALLAGFANAPSNTTRLALCAPSPYLNQMQRLLGGSRLNYGGQDLSDHVSGAFTGQISAAMLKEFGATLALVGHSERRQYQGESSELVAQKAAVAVAAGITPVICVGESLIERESGLAEATVAAQLAPCAELIQKTGAQLVFAYEPVWAIGTGKTASPMEAQAMQAFIRQEIASYAPNAASVSILYGGSVKASNAKELFAQPDIDGGLIGGASLVAADFLVICNAL